MDDVYMGVTRLLRRTRVWLANMRLFIHGAIEGLFSQLGALFTGACFAWMESRMASLCGDEMSFFWVRMRLSTRAYACPCVVCAYRGQRSNQPGLDNHHGHHAHHVCRAYYVYHVYVP